VHSTSIRILVWVAIFAGLCRSSVCFLSKMKFKSTVSSSSRKQRKIHLSSDSTSRRKLMSAHLSKELRGKHNVRAVPLRKGDEVKIVRGSVNAKGREGKVIAVYRKKFVIHVERVTREKVNGQPVPIPIQASNVIITKLNMDKDVAKDRKALLTRKAAGRSAANAMAEVD